MSGKKFGRVPVLEDAFEINLAKLLAVSKRTGQPLLRVDDGKISGEVLVVATKLAVRLGGKVFRIDIAQVHCLNGGRLRPLLKCPRAHEGNFQSLYYWCGELACRQCHGLRYRSTLAPSAVGRACLARQKLIMRLGATQGSDVPARQPGCWRKKHARQITRLGLLTQAHYGQLKAYLARI